VVHHVRAYLDQAAEDRPVAGRRRQDRQARQPGGRVHVEVVPQLQLHDGAAGEDERHGRHLRLGQRLAGVAQVEPERRAVDGGQPYLARHRLPQRLVRCFLQDGDEVGDAQEHAAGAVLIPEIERPARDGEVLAVDLDAGELDVVEARVGVAGEEPGGEGVAGLRRGVVAEEDEALGVDGVVGGEVVGEAVDLELRDEGEVAPAEADHAGHAAEVADVLESAPEDHAVDAGVAERERLGAEEPGGVGGAAAVHVGVGALGGAGAARLRSELLARVVRAWHVGHREGRRGRRRRRVGAAGGARRALHPHEVAGDVEHAGDDLWRRADAEAQHVHAGVGRRVLALATTAVFAAVGRHGLAA
ncbi:Os01g0868550, partial [Oryza sativa Japonica Group]